MYPYPGQSLLLVFHLFYKKLLRGSMGESGFGNCFWYTAEFTVNMCDKEIPERCSDFANSLKLFREFVNSEILLRDSVDKLKVIYFAKKSWIIYIIIL